MLHKVLEIERNDFSPKRLTAWCQKRTDNNAKKKGENGFSHIQLRKKGHQAEKRYWELILLTFSLINKLNMPNWETERGR